MEITIHFRTGAADEKKVLENLSKMIQDAKALPETPFQLVDITFIVLEPTPKPS